MATAVLQARMSSSRLPGKVLKPLLGQPMILRQIERLRRCRRLERIVVATSAAPSDDILAKTLSEAGVEVARGPLDDVLGRFLKVIEVLDLTGDMVRLTADCPLADPDVIDACIAFRREGDLDYASNGQVRTYPRGLDVEVFTVEALRRAAAEATSDYDREHVTPWLYRTEAPFRRGDLVQAPDRSEFRWTVDLPGDFAFVERVYAALYPGNPVFTSADILALPFARRESDV
ncbi:glycosyltransferase family protein [Phenylobacterium sp.]|uniref:glycosyltransferase family protein n=1 Tax=Phenylobacterium sp. TaxID=1871053 RepID=UPI0025F361AA|nr:glycosyltransferase family protein [Phenylobacterium sp.]MCA6284972.1 glycosyltransferase family protein [Phenylobacterium sp.]MCA6311134.1 glycosyltransferase family protein [Phenylobacterium sp.]MCA6324029.1 glycosyltransferase family protein [Phenylobacterium sp.]MCA6336485.1 glycosyltransferase family protein [Phenylobacterium sp.]MCA6339547.1 glycosyltransferase family protein [Phenylobacterium sp.]